MKDCAGEDQQQFNGLDWTPSQSEPEVVFRQTPPSGGVGGGGVPIVGSRYIAAPSEDIEDVVRAILNYTGCPKSLEPRGILIIFLFLFTG
jgi:hypothetical protein